MKSNLKKYFAVLAVAILGLTACDKFDEILDKTPKAKISPETYFKNATELQLFTNSFYNNLLPKNPYSEKSDQYIGNDPGNFLRGGNNRITPETGGSWTWTDLRKMNTCLDYMETQCEDEAAKRHYSALCKFFRAYFYFDKVKKFGDVPWIDHELDSDSPELQAPRDSREVVMTHMLEDIDEAIAGLPESYSGHNYRATKWAALALKARFCLYEGTFRKYHNISYPERDYKYYLQLAASAAEELMTTSPHKLYSTGKPDLDYAVLFSQYEESTAEYILSINFDFGTELMHNATAMGLMNSQGRQSLTKKFVNCYLMKDGSRFTDKDGYATMTYSEEVVDRDPRLGQTILLPGGSRIHEENGTYSYSVTPQPVDFTVTITGYQMRKFVMPEDNMGKDKFDRSYNDLPVFRLGEVYLNFAEAKAELGTLTQSDLDKSVNLLRDRVGMPHLTMGVTADPYLQTDLFYPNVTGSQKALILEIRRERAIELAQEGFRLDDVFRWKCGKVLDNPASYYGMYVPGLGEYDLDGDGKPEVCYYIGSTKSKATTTCEVGVTNCVFLTEDTKGYLAPMKSWWNAGNPFNFNESRDYYYPIPLNDLSLNRNLIQNPGWDEVKGSE